MNPWNPADILVPTDSQQKSNYAVLLLNQPILDKKYFANLWNNAAIRVSVDGGGNQWYSLYTELNTLKLPDIANGDFDSIHDNVKELFRNSSVEIVETPDQDATDFTKALKILSSKIGNDTSFPQLDKILAFCEPSGRFDQIMANIETLYESTSLFPHRQLYLAGSTNLTWLLGPTVEHQIKVKDLLKISKGKIYCSLMPIGCPCKVTTTGLKWNLENDEMAFGVLVSTSNEVANEDVEEVTVISSNSIIWSMEIYRS